MSLALSLASETVRAEGVISIYTGVSHTFAADLHVSQPLTGSDAIFHDVAWAPHPFTQGAPYYGARISVFFGSHPHLGAVLDRTHYKLYAETADVVSESGIWNRTPVGGSVLLGTRVQELQIAHGINLTSLGGEYRMEPSFQRAHWETHVGAGLLIYLPHSEGTIDGYRVTGGYQYGGVGGQIFGGTEYGILDHLGLMIEGKFDAAELDVDLDPMTRISLPVRTLNLIGGLSWHF